MLRLDRQLDHWVVTHRLAALDPAFRFLSAIGVWGVVWLAIAAVLALTRRELRIAVAVTLADLVADLTASGLQELIRRPRPSVPTLIARPHSFSFPSGHAATSFACATVLAALAPRLRIAAFLLAAAIAWSRVYVGVHYPLDVLGGAIWGLLVGLAVLRSLAWLARRWRGARHAGR